MGVFRNRYCENIDTLRLVYTVGHVSEILKVANRTVAKWFDGDLLRGYRVSYSMNPDKGDRRITHKSLVDFMEIYDFPENLLVNFLLEKGYISEKLYKCNSD